MSQGYGQGRRGGRVTGVGTGRMQGKSRGSGSECICPQCGSILLHKRGIPCFEEKCPKCGTNMVRV